MSDFGAQLKQARESRGISLRQISTSTKISTVALEALERGDLSKLPGGIFSRAFVRAYAVEVGLNPDEVVAQFLVELGVHASRANDDDVPPEVTADDRAFLELQRRAAMALRIGIVVVVVLIIAAVVWWNMTRRPAPPVVETQAPAAAPAPAPVEAPAAPPVAQVASPTPDPAGVWIEVTASSDCWMRVTTDGVQAMERVFTRGERQRFDATKEITLQVGSAGAISWTVNGRPARALGRVGDVRTVTVSAATAAEFYQTPEPDGRPTPNASGTGRP